MNIGFPNHQLLQLQQCSVVAVPRAAASLRSARPRFGRGSLPPATAVALAGSVSARDC